MCADEPCAHFGQARSWRQTQWLDRVVTGHGIRRLQITRGTRIGLPWLSDAEHISFGASAGTVPQLGPHT